MYTNDHKALIAMANEREISIRPEMINRHGLITGVTGSGKTVSLQTMAETFSAMGVPVFMADVKGDLSGIAAPGTLAGKPGQRVKELKLDVKGYRNQGFPVCFWDVFGQHGHPLRATISDVGPIMLSRLLNLNDVQTGVLQIIFRIADDNGLLLLDIKDLRSMAQHVADERESYRTQYGQISTQSIGAIQRALLRLEEEGGNSFFGEPALQLADLLKLENGLGVINILDATKLINSPSLYSCVLLWLLSDLFEKLPEVGDRNLPKIVFFFDEAHLMFNGISPVLLQKVEQVVRLIRSRGVGIYFISQNPSDMPDSILGQLGNRIQHALRAFTPKDQKAVRAAAQAFRPNPAFSTEEAIGTLGAGEALVSFLDANGAPEIVERALILPPESQVGPIDEQMRHQLIAHSLVAGKYDEPIDRESAYEILAARAGWLKQAQDAENRAKDEAKAQKLLAAQQREAAKAARDAERERKRQEANDPFRNILSTATRSVSGTVAREIGKSVFGTGIGGKIGTSLVRGILGSLLGGK